VIIFLIISIVIMSICLIKSYHLYVSGYILEAIYKLLQAGFSYWIFTDINYEIENLKEVDICKK